jgi:hypothetical protein
MTKKRKQNKKIFLSIIIAFIILLFIITIKQSEKTKTPTGNLVPSSNNSFDKTGSSIKNKQKTFYSKYLKIHIDIPEGINYKETPTYVALKRNNFSGEILISYNGTNYETIDEVFRNEENNQKLRIKENKERLVINKLPVYKMDVEYLDYSGRNYRVYYFYKNYTIYRLHTTSPDLYSDLDQIAQSFRFEQ